MLWILSTLRVLPGFVQRCTVRAFLPLFLVLTSVLSGAACRDDQADTPPGQDAELDDSDTSYIPGDLMALWGLAAVLDYNGDGRQDVLVPMLEGDGLPSWLLLKSTGATGEGTFTFLEQALPFDAELSAQGATIHNRLGPRITDVDGDGTPDVLLPMGDVFTLFRSLGSQQDLIASVHDGLNAHDPADPGNVPTLLVTYGTLIDKAITDGPPALLAEEGGYDHVSKGWFAPSCAYPLRCVVGPRQVVREYSRNNGADKQRIAFQRAGSLQNLQQCKK